MIGNAKLKGYVYQDVLSAYLVIKEIFNGELDSEFLFDVKKTENASTDKFDDVSIFENQKSTFYQIKYSDENNYHILTKSDFTEKNKYDLALQNLYKSWKGLKGQNINFKICLAWALPKSDDEILNYIVFVDDEPLFPNSKCFKFDITKIWPDNKISSKWRALTTYAKKEKLSKEDFSTFLDELLIEINLPKTTLLESFDGELDSYYLSKIKEIGIGQFPNNNQSPEECAYKLCHYIRAKAAEGKSIKITCKEILQFLNIKTDFGGIKEYFPVDLELLTDTPDRVFKIKEILKKENKILVEGAPGSGKSWLINNLEKEIKNEFKIIKHYCYTDLTDSLISERITTNNFLGSLLHQLNELHFINLHEHPNKYSSNLPKLNKVLSSIQQPIVIIIDGLDHIYRIFEQKCSELCENEIRIIETISKIDFSNPFVHIILFSQPIKQLDILSTFYKFQLPKVDEKYIQLLLPKYGIVNFKLNKLNIVQTIASKANGNPLFISYLLKEFNKNNGKESFDWLCEIPDYDINLRNYYSYIIRKFTNALNTSEILCCVNYSVTEKELAEITGDGDYVKEQLQVLYPILRYSYNFGYSVYHESFKRYILEELESKNIHIKDVVLPKLITWLENKGFYENIKSYSFLLQYYYENNEYNKIEQYINLDFLYKSLAHLFPIQTIRNNHEILLQSIKKIHKLDKEIILIQQSQTIAIFDELDENAIGALLLATKEKGNEDLIYNFLYPNETLAFDFSKSYKILKYLCLHGFNDVNWNILDEYRNQECASDIGSIIVELLNTKNYRKINTIINNCLGKEMEAEFWLSIFDSFEWYYLTIDDTIISKCPTLIRAYYIFFYSKESFHDLLTDILSRDNFYDKTKSIQLFMKFFWVVRATSSQEIEKEINQISDKFWFRNWLIFAIKIIKLSQCKYNPMDILSVFSLLVQDLDPFKGHPRTCDLHIVENLIHKTLCFGLKLCKSNFQLKKECFDILERLTETQTSFQNSPGGPLTISKYVEIKSLFMPVNYINEYPVEKIYRENSYYHLCAEQFFFYTYLFSKRKQIEIANKYYDEGIKSILTVRSHKDYCLSDLLDISYVYHEYSKQLSIKDFYKFEHLSYLMQFHTDRSDVGTYPDEWFKFFIQTYPNDSIKYLIYQILNSDMVYGYFEYAFKIFLENEYSYQNPTLWFLLWLSLPILQSNESLNIGFKIRDKLDKSLLTFFDEWMKNRLVVNLVKDEIVFSNEVKEKFREIYSISFQDISEKNDITSSQQSNKDIYKFSATSLEEAYVYFEEIPYDKELDLENIQKYILTLENFEQRKELIIEIVKKLTYKKLDTISIIFNSSSEELIYFNVALFVYTNRGGFEVLTNFNYLQTAYMANKEKTIFYLEEILAVYLIGNSHAYKLTSNLINSLIKINLGKKIIISLFQLIDKSITAKFPDVDYRIFQENNYFELNEYTYDELLTTLLIARLKTFTGEKNRNILFGLKYIAKSRPQLLIKAYIYIFSYPDLLLPSQRAIILQVLYESIPDYMINDRLKRVLRNNYPSKFFTEDFFIRKLCKLNNNILPCYPNRIVYESNSKDGSFFEFINDKYKRTYQHYGTISGFYNEYQKYRHEYSEKYRKYSMQLEEICAPIINYQDIAYQIVNQRLYEQMDSNEKNNNLDENDILFSIEQSIQSISSLSGRPNFLPYPEKMNNSPQNIYDYSDDEWVIIGAFEEQYTSIDNYKKELNCSRIFLVTDQKFEQPLTMKMNYNELDKYNIFLLSGYLVHQLNLQYNEDIFSGFKYYRDNEIVARIITWKGKYMGSVEDGYEIPTFEGSALLVKYDLLKEIEVIYQGKLIILKKIDK